jgi:hypothetical protein
MLGAPLEVNTVSSVGIRGAGFANPSGGDRPLVTAFDGCQVAPLPSPYYLGSAATITTTSTSAPVSARPGRR